MRPTEGTKEAIDDTEGPRPTPRGRRRVVLLGLFGLLVGGALGALAAAPQWVEGRAGAWLEEAFAERHQGSLRIRSFELAWFDEQRVHGLELLDPEGRTVGVADLRIPRLLSLAGAWLGSKGDLGEIDVRFEADLVEGDDGVTNLARALESRPDVDPDSGGLRLGDWIGRVNLRAEQSTFEDAALRGSGRGPLRFESLDGTLARESGGLASVRLEGVLVDERGVGRSVYLAADVHGPFGAGGGEFPLVDVHGRAEGVPTGLVEVLVGKEDGGALRRGLGDRLDIEGRARGTADGGGFDGRIAGERGEWSFEGRVEATDRGRSSDSRGAESWLRRLSLTVQGEDRGGLADLLGIPRETFHRDFGSKLTLVAEPRAGSGDDGVSAGGAAATESTEPHGAAHVLRWQGETGQGQAVVHWSLAGVPGARASGSWEGVPVAWLDNRVGAEGLLSEALGAEFRLEFEGGHRFGVPGGQGTEAIELRLESQRARIQFEGIPSESKLVSGEEGVLKAELTLGPLVRSRLVEGLLPFLRGVERAAEGAPGVRVGFEEFSLPLDGDLAELSGRVRLECIGLRASFLPGLADLPGELGERFVFDLPTEAIELRIDRGIVRYGGLEFEVDGERLPIRGAYDLVGAELALGTEVPLGLLGRGLRGELGQALALLDPDTRIPIEIGGTPTSPKLSLASDFLQRAIEDAVRKKAEAGLLEILRRR